MQRIAVSSSLRLASHRCARCRRHACWKETIRPEMGGVRDKRSNYKDQRADRKLQRSKTSKKINTEQTMSKTTHYLDIIELERPYYKDKDQRPDYRLQRSTATQHTTKINDQTTRSKIKDHRSPDRLSSLLSSSCATTSDWRRTWN